MPVAFSGEITRMFKNCPKPDGWFGCFMVTYPDHKTIVLKGKTTPPLHDGDVIQIQGHDVPPTMGHREIQMDACVRAPSKKSFTKLITGPSYPGIGPNTADKLWAAFGPHVLYVIENLPDKLDPYVAPAQKITLMQYKSNAVLQALLRIAVPSITDIVIDDVCIHYGGWQQAYNAITANPYCLLWDIECGPFRFKNVDRIAQYLRIPPNDPNRVAAAARYSLSQTLKSTGHVCLNCDDPAQWNRLISDTLGYLQTNTVDPDLLETIFRDINMSWKVLRQENGVNWLYSKETYWTEVGCSTNVARLVKETPRFHGDLRTVMMYLDKFQQKTGMYLDISQQTAITMSLLNDISVITGGPGYGKTTVIQCILYIWYMVMGKTCYLTGPTGKSVQKMKEQVTALTDQMMDDIEKAHPLIRDADMPQVATAAKFHVMYKSQTQNIKNQLANKLVICDETSMISLSAAHDLLKEFPDCQFIFIGDADQLQPIDYGSFFTDLCDSKWVPTTKLSTCYRVKSNRIITQNADKVKAGLATGKLGTQPDVFEFRPFMPADTPACLDAVAKAYQAAVQRWNMNEVCVIAPTNRGPTGVFALNMTIQSIMTPLGPNAIPGVKTTTKGTPIIETRYAEPGSKNATTLRVGDHIMMTANKMAHNEYLMVNGDCAVITAYYQRDDMSDESYIIVKMDSDGSEYNISQSDFEYLMLAYAFTVHKSQGSEYNSVLFVAQDSLSSPFIPDGFATRNLLYTAWTRAKEQVLVFGNHLGITRCCQNQLPRRQSLLIHDIDALLQ